MPTSVKDMLAEANAAVPRIGREEAAALMERGDVLVVDVRDAPELQAGGKVPGAKHVSRGMLEFRADPDSPYHDKDFDRDRTVLVYQPRRLQGVERGRRGGGVGLSRGAQASPSRGRSAGGSANRRSAVELPVGRPSR